MSKYVLSEERLQEIISEAINEAIEDEGLGRWLGNAYQWGRNKVNNFKGEFNAGRNNQRWQNRDFDPYHGMKDADQMRNFNGDEYAQYRYNLTADRNNNATNSWQNNFGTKTNRHPSANGDRFSNYTGDGQGNPQQNNAPLKSGNGQPSQMPDAAALAQQQPQQQQGGGITKQDVAATKQSVATWGAKGLGKAKQNVIMAALGEYEKNHPELNEDTIREVVTNVLREYINEVGDTVKGQEKLGKLAGKRMGQSWRTAEKGDVDKAMELGDRYKAAHQKARDERKAADSDKQPKMRKAYYKALDKQAELAESINEVGDTPRGQRALGKLSARREREAYADRRNGDEDGFKKKFTTSVEAYCKARDERNAKYKDGDAVKNFMLNNYRKGEKDGKRLTKESVEEGRFGNFVNRTFNGKNIQARVQQLSQQYQTFQKTFNQLKGYMSKNLISLVEQDMEKLNSFISRIRNGEKISDKTIQYYISDIQEFLQKGQNAKNKRIESQSSSYGSSYGGSSSSSSYSGGNKPIYNPGGMGSAYQKYGIPDDVLYGDR